MTRAAAGWDIDTVKRSLNVLSQTIDETYPHLSPLLDGVAKLSDTVGKRDEEVKHLLAQANKVASVLGDRSQQVDRLLVNAKALLVAFNERSRAISALLGNVSYFSLQVKGLINDNPNLNHVLEQLRIVSDLLVARKDDLAQILVTLGKAAAAVNEAVASGPYFKVILANLLPYWILQPWVDAAFKKRGIDPEEFWRNAGLPAFRFPDPNGTRLPNGAPPPAPPVLEGTPDHPGPAVPPGSPCSYTPTPDLLPRPWNPLPCAGINQNLGPFGPLGGPDLAPPDVMASPPNPNGLPPTPGIPIAGRPGEVPPDVPAHLCRCRRTRRQGRVRNRPTHPFQALLRPIPRRHRRRRRWLPDRRRRPDRASSCPHPSSRPAYWEVSQVVAEEAWEVARVEHRLRYPQLATSQTVAGVGDRRVASGGVGSGRLLCGPRALPEVDQQHGGGLLHGDQRTLLRGQGPDHGCAGGFDRQDRARRRQDESDVPLQQQIQGARERTGGDP
ncbi:virulence factor mce family protein [Mycobacterium xenopi 4042]|uniref:Virulence factor mce family protein n=1 Tax=Mycobacterium xenopi 4042 TaxID=1299334 RepID=X8BKI4_MYCXE|nr:virulence factor mce family protein [Mycobacterium xenopi 4042]